MREVDFWIGLNRERILAGNDAVVSLLPYLEQSTSAEALRPMLVRLEAETSEVTYSDFDGGRLSATFGRAGMRLREGLAAIEAGDAEAAGRALSRGIWLYQDAIERTAALLPEERPPKRSFRWGFVAFIVVLLVWLL